ILQAKVEARAQRASGTRLLDQLDVVDDAAEPVLQHALTAVLPGEPIVVCELEPLEAVVVDIGEADDVPDDLRGRIEAAVLAERSHARNAERHHVRRLRRRDVPFQIDELAVEVARDPLRELALRYADLRGELAEPIQCAAK